MRDPEEALGLEGREAAGLVQGHQLLVRLEELSVCSGSNTEMSHSQS